MGKQSSSKKKGHSRPIDSMSLDNAQDIASNNEFAATSRGSVQDPRREATTQDKSRRDVESDVQIKRRANYLKHQEKASNRAQAKQGNKHASQAAVSGLLEQELHDRQLKNKARTASSNEVPNKVPKSNRDGDIANDLEAAKLKAIAEKNLPSSGILEQELQDKQIKHRSRVASRKRDPNKRAAKSSHDEDIAQDLEAAKLKAIAKKNGPRLHHDGDFEDVELSEPSPAPPTLRPGAVSIVPTESSQIDDNDITWEERESNPYDPRDDDPQDPEQPGSELHLINAVLVDDDREEERTPDIPYVHATPAPEEKPARNKKLFYILGAAVVVLIIVVVVVVVVLVTGGNNDSSATVGPEDLVNASLVFQFDDKPEETGWTLECGGFNIRNVPPSVYRGQENKLFTVNTEVALEEECELTIIDSGNDGIPGGFFQLYLGNDTSNEDALLAEGSGDDFTDVQVVTFTAFPLKTSSPGVTPTVSPTRSPTEIPY